MQKRSTQDFLKWDNKVNYGDFPTFGFQDFVLIVVKHQMNRQTDRQADRQTDCVVVKTNVFLWFCFVWVAHCVSYFHAQNFMFFTAAMYIHVYVNIISMVQPTLTMKLFFGAKFSQRDSGIFLYKKVHFVFLEHKKTQYELRKNARIMSA